MNLLAALGQLPFTLFLSSLALVASALPVEGVELKVLTPDDFHQTIANGVWLVEHFSPYCSHCRSFAPTWTKLAEDNAKSSDPGIHLAQVNCIVHGDLCQKNGVAGYPELQLYRNGELLEKYKKARSYELLSEYIAKHAEPSSPDPEPPATVAEEAVVPKKIVNPSGSVISLDEKSFQAAVNEGPIFVKFFAPWCGHCKKLAPIWLQLASHMQHKLAIAEVNCEDQAGLCKQQDVPGYPMLYFYSGTGTKTEYTGGRKFDQLSAFADQATAPAVQELKYEDFESAVSQNPVMYLLLHQPSDTAPVNRITQIAPILLGSPPIFTSSSPDLFIHFDLSLTTSAVLLALKDADARSPTATLSLTKSVDRPEISKWLLANRLPTAIELNSDTFQSVMNAKHRPLVVVVATDALARDADRVKEIARLWRQRNGEGSKRDVVFTWMDASKWTSWLKSMYGIKASELPGVVISNHQDLIYYDTDPNGAKIEFDSKSIFSTLDGIQNGTVKARNSENLIERLARYINNRITGVEAYVSAHPWWSALMFLSALFVVFLGLKRALGDDDFDGRDYRHASPYGHKSGRLD